MATWEEMIGASRPENTDSTLVVRAAALKSATEVALNEAFEPHLAAQETFWKVITAFLAKHGSLMYEQPDFDRPRLTTGPMALEQIEVDEAGNALAVPSIRLSTTEDSLIKGFFGKRAKNPLTRYVRPSQEKVLGAIRQKFAETALKDDPEGPYIEVTTQFVTHLGANGMSIKNAGRGSGGMHGSRVPKVLLGWSELAILPDTPPPNLVHILGCSNSDMPIGPPGAYVFTAPAREVGFETEADYRLALDEETERIIDIRDRHIASMNVITDIINRADAINLPLYDYFERMT